MTTVLGSAEQNTSITAGVLLDSVVLDTKPGTRGHKNERDSHLQAMEEVNIWNFSKNTE